MNLQRRARRLLGWLSQGGFVDEAVVTPAFPQLSVDPAVARRPSVPPSRPRQLLDDRPPDPLSLCASIAGGGSDPASRTQPASPTQSAEEQPALAGFAVPPTTPTPATENATPDIHFRRASLRELHEVVRTLLAGPQGSPDAAQTDEFIRSAADRKIDLNRVRLVERQGRVVWVALPVVSPGRTALILAPPLPHRPADAAVAGQLLERVCEELAADDVRLTQTLLDPADAAGRIIFQAHRFVEMAELIYLSGSARRRQTPPTLPPNLLWVGYEPQTHELFKSTVAATYDGSLDCPGLNGVRDMDDVLAGHRASGEFDPRWWQLLCERESDGPPRPLGVLLLSPVTHSESLELVYLGLVPTARGRKLGDLLMRQALSTLVALNLSRLSLAVDSRNQPALSLYFRHGLSRSATRIALIRDLRPIAAGSGGRTATDSARLPEQRSDLL